MSPNETLRAADGLACVLGLSRSPTATAGPTDYNKPTNLAFEATTEYITASLVLEIRGAAVKLNERVLYP